MDGQEVPREDVWQRWLESGDEMSKGEMRGMQTRVYHCNGTKKKKTM